ncbi:glutaredoxin family protein [Caenimonas sp. SL110]|uniref:glutaredoxin family protein n=1 Tax=Caenimonas sp. SL110 TaxID=1450524 RepID=UPI0009E44930|nr:glutaredoxin family protein [Caenimonas sp. SL110]
MAIFARVATIASIAAITSGGVVGLIGASALLAGDANAQQIYRIVGPDGRVTFSDQPPAQSVAKPGAAAPAAGQSPTTSGASGAATPLPFELRQVVSRYPVVLYTGVNCAPCASGRAMLSSRGIPFTERTVTTPDDIEAYRRLGGANTLPFLTIGGQQIKGYSDFEWAQYLDAAGYPKTSVLPSSYRPAPATPLVAIQQAPATAAATAPAASPANASSPPPPPAESNPAGIRF